MTTNTKNKQSHTIAVRDFGPDGNGISVYVHRLGCGCQSLLNRDGTIVKTYRVEAHEDEHKRAGVIAQEVGLAWFDYSIVDCALGI